MIPKNVNQPLKTVAQRVQSCRAVMWAIDVHGDRLLERLDTTYASLLSEGQETPFPTQLALFGKKLTGSRDQIVGVDRAYRDQRALESVFRGRRDTIAAELLSHTIQLRKAFSGFYSEDRLAELGFARSTPRQADQLLEYATHLVDRLNDPEIDLSGSEYDGVQLDVSLLVVKVVESFPKLRQAIDAVAQQERQSEVLLLAKNEVLDQHNKTFLWIARTVESLFSLAGLEEVAKRIRPSNRRPGVTEKPFEEPESGDDEASQEGTSETETQETEAPVILAAA